MNAKQYFDASRRGLAGLVAFVLLAGGLLSSVPAVKAAAGDGASSNIELLDTNNNGYIDRITFDVANPNTETWALVGSAPYGLSVTQTGNDITIASVSLATAATANPVTIQVDLDETDTNFSFDTNAVTSGTPIELIYTQVTGDQTCTNCINDGTDEELNAIATGDTGATDTEIDSAAPTIGAGTSGINGSSTYLDNDRDGKVDRIGITFSETLDAASVMSLNDFTVTAGDFTGLASSTDTTDLITSAVSVVFVTLPTEATAVDTYDNSGTFAITTQNAFSLTDGTNTNTTLTSYRIWLDDASPIVTQADYQDGDNDGKIDRVLLHFSEVLHSSSTYSASALSFTDVGDFTGAAFGSSTTDRITSNTSTVTILFGTEATVVDTHDDSGTLAIDDSGSSFTLYNENADPLTTTSNVVVSATTYLDDANPVIASITPGDAATNISVSSNIAVTFSEAMDTGFVEGTEFSVTPDTGTFATSWTSSDHVVTINPGTDFANNTSYAVALTAAQIVDASVGATLNVSGTYDGTWSFTTRRAGSSSTTPSAPLTYGVTVDSPVGGETFDPGSVQEITWTNTGTGATAFVNIYYSPDGGTNSILVASNEANDGSYMWTVPNVDTTDAVVKVVLTDLVDTLATDISGAFTITGTTTPQDAIDQNPTDTTTQYGPSPVTGELEPITEVQPGDFIRGASYDTIYYVGSDMTRRPFINEQIFFTWQNDFDNVMTVTDATLPTLELDSPMLPKPGVVLIKIQSDPRVYAVEANSSDDSYSVKRWIPTEGIAQSLYGADWADYVIDVPPTLFSWFIDGVDMTTADEVDMSIMKKRIGA